MVGVSGGAARISTLVIDTDLDMGLRDLKVDDIVESTAGNGVNVEDLKTDTIAEKTTGTGVTIDGVKLKDRQLHQPDVLMSQNKDKVASDNLRHSIDEYVTKDSQDYVLIDNKELTFTNGIKGVIRVKCYHDAPSGQTVYSKLYKNGEDLGGVEHSIGSGSSETWSEDITVDFEAGDKLQVYGKTSSGTGAWHSFRVYYDDGTGFSAVAVAVTGAD